MAMMTQSATHVHHDTSLLRRLGLVAAVIGALPSLAVGAIAPLDDLLVDIPPRQAMVETFGSADLETGSVDLEESGEPAASGYDTTVGALDQQVFDQQVFDQQSIDRQAIDQYVIDHQTIHRVPSERDDALPATEMVVDVHPADLLASYQHHIDAQQTLHGTYDPSVGESLAAMARLLQLQGNHDAALLAYQRAMHIQRVNNGIYSLAQEPMLRGMIDSYQARHDILSVGQHLDHLHWLYAKTFGQDDPRTLPLVMEISEWHLQAYDQNPSRKGLYHLVRAHKLVASAIDLVNHQVEGGTLTVLPLLHKLVVTNFYLANHQRRYPVGSSEGFSFRTSTSNMAEPLSQEEILVINSYQNGRRAQEQIVATVFNNPDATSSDRIQALAELGDWYLLFGRVTAAQEAYRKAWQVALTDPDMNADLNTVFGDPRIISLQSSSLPRRNRTAADADDNTPRVIARLTVNARGEVKEADIVEPDSARDPSANEELTRELKKLRFRPRIVNGEMVASNDVPFTLPLLAAD